MKEKISKRVGSTLFCAIALLMAAIIIMHHNPAANQQEEILKKVISCTVIAFSCVVFIVLYEKVTTLPIELYQNRHLIWKLAKNDFKKRYAGSYLGMVWAMIQPVVTVVMYWLVFDVIMHGAGRAMRGDEEISFVLFLTSGLVPWFFFTEAWTNGTHALLEYNYLVKKVVFKISILPIIKVIGATFIHAFFACILVLIAAFYGYFPTIYMLQIFYYSFCTFILVLALSYTTCALMVFMRDIAQILAIILQIGMWATPIMWDFGAIGEGWAKFLKLNPMVYIVNGYRDAIYGHSWFFEDFFSTMYFWIITVVLFGIGAITFKKLKIHFADVL
ncbi:MAG: ABC transporter permease [Lachnospiraceae bacterium]|nr:ABC transporter permease [Lachnospiraceae bacterium]